MKLPVVNELIGDKDNSNINMVNRSTSTLSTDGTDRHNHSLNFVTFDHALNQA